jgi:hypothetical protein
MHDPIGLADPPFLVMPFGSNPVADLFVSQDETRWPRNSLILDYLCIDDEVSG